jgi:hypothetical protein
LQKKKEEQAKEINELNENYLELEKKMARENEALIEHHLNEIETLTKQFNLDKKKLDQFDEVQLELNEYKSQNEKLTNGKKILEEEKTSLQNLTQNLKNTQKKLSKEYEEKLKEIEKKKSTKSSKVKKEGEKNMMAPLTVQEYSSFKDILNQTTSKQNKERAQQFICGSEWALEKLLPTTFWSMINKYHIKEPEKNILQEIKFILEKRKTILTEEYNYRYEALLLLQGSIKYIEGERTAGDFFQNSHSMEGYYESDKNLCLISPLTLLINFCIFSSKSMQSHEYKILFDISVHLFSRFSNA